jgi:5-methylcytosine-specific restriction endonuclease McrA
MSISTKLRRYILDRDDYTCQYCGEVLPAERWDDAPSWMGGQRWRAVLHVDHVIPKSRGGCDLPGNLVTTCVPCNLSKAAKTLREWLYA